MLIKKAMHDYDEYVKVQNGRGSINDSTLRYNTTVKKIFSTYGINQDDNILDIGTRNGQFIKELHDHGYINSYGTDISTGASTLWQQYDSQLLKYFAIEDAQIALTCFGINYKFITLSHVLEHMYDVDAVLNNIKEALETDGLVYIVVPCEDNTRHGAHYTSFPHMDDLVKLFTNHGYTVVEHWHNRSFQPELQLVVKYTK